MRGIALLLAAALLQDVVGRQCLSTSDGLPMHALSVLPETDGTCLHLFHNPKKEGGGDLDCTAPEASGGLACREQGYFHKRRVGGLYGGDDSTCCDNDVLEKLKTMLEKLRRYFDKCDNCRTVWAHLLCAANCRADQADLIEAANATLHLPPRLRITQDMCDQIWHACSDDGGYTGDTFFYKNGYGQGRQRSDRKLFCEAGLFDNSPKDTRLALSQCEATTRTASHANSTSALNATVANARCEAQPLGIRVVGADESGPPCFVAGTSAAPPKVTCLSPAVLSNMQGVPEGRGVTLKRWYSLPENSQYAIETRLPVNHAIAGYTGARIERGGFGDGTWRRFNEFANYCSSSYSLGAGSIFLFLVVLFGAACLTNAMHQYHMHWLPESAVYILIGLAMGFLAQDESFMALCGMPVANASALGFNQALFMFVLLPPIIFNSGYALRTKNMASSIGSILTFAVIGTVVSTLFVAFFIWAFTVFNFIPGMTDAEQSYPDLSWSESLMFGALISAVDPVATLGIFESLKVDPALEALVCGEALINDACAIILFSSVKQYVLAADPDFDQSGVGAVGEAVSRFFSLSLGSLALGLCVGITSALFFKFFSFRNNPGMEIVTFFLFAYGSFVVAELEFLHCSGILSTLTCGVVMATYTQHNMSEGGVMQTGNISSMLCTFADMLVFMMTGAAMAINIGSISWGFTALVVVLIFVARAIAVYGLSWGLNYGRAKPLIAKNHQHMLWFAGLRGAVAVGLTTQLPSKYRHEMSAATCVIVFITVILMGSSTPYMLKYHGVETNVLFGCKTEEDDNLGMKTFYMVDDYVFRPLLMSKPDFRVRGHIFLSISVTRCENLPKFKATGDLLYPRAFGTINCNGDTLAQSQPAIRGATPTYHDLHVMVKLPIGREKEFLEFTKIKLAIWCKVHRFSRPTTLGYVLINGADLVKLLAEEELNPNQRKLKEKSADLVVDPDLLKERMAERLKWKKMRHKMLGLAPERASADPIYEDLHEQAEEEHEEEEAAAAEGEGGGGGDVEAGEGAGARRRSSAAGGASGAKGEEGEPLARSERRQRFRMVEGVVKAGQCLGKRCGDSVQAFEDQAEDVLDQVTKQPIGGKLFYKVSMEKPDLHNKGRILALAKGWLSVTRELAGVAAAVTKKASIKAAVMTKEGIIHAPENARTAAAATKSAARKASAAAQKTRANVSALTSKLGGKGGRDKGTKVVV